LNDSHSEHEEGYLWREKRPKLSGIGVFADTNEKCGSGSTSRWVVLATYLIHESLFCN
jgi:hypothetical protein